MLAVDIETASPHKEPTDSRHFRDTSYFELVAIAVGYKQKGGDIDTRVFFREDGWGGEHTHSLIGKVDEYPKQMGFSEPDEVLTYNGTRFDEIHLKNWADDNSYLRDRIHSLFEKHIDLSEEADRQLKQNGWSLEDVCRTAGIEVEETYFDDYNLPQEVMEAKPADDRVVTGEHIGGFLGEVFVDAVQDSEDYQHTKRLSGEYGELQRMLEDYAEADIKPLFELYDKIQNR